MCVVTSSGKQTVDAALDHCAHEAKKGKWARCALRYLQDRAAILFRADQMGEPRTVEGVAFEAGIAAGYASKTECCLIGARALAADRPAFLKHCLSV